MINKTHFSIIANFYRLCILPIRSLLLFLFILLPSWCFLQSFTEGENFFRSDRPESAIESFQMSLTDGTAQPSVYNYMGIAYMQTGNTQKALDTFLQGIATAGTDKRTLYYNAGNAAYVLQNYTKANEYFSYAIVADSTYGNAYLNRGNTNIQLSKYNEAISDYNQYLALVPNSDQADAIRSMIATLTEDMAFQEREAERLAAEAERLAEQEQRIAEEQQRFAEEQQRIADEQKAAEAERRQRILEQVSASLQSSTATNLSAGTEGGLEYEYEEAELE